MKTIITTVGTSLISNYLEENNGDREFQLYSKMNYMGLTGMESEVDSLVQKLVVYWRTKPEESCAEIATIVQYYVKNPKDVFRIKLLASDTALSYICAVAIEKLLIHPLMPVKIEEVIVKVIAGLSVKKGSKLDYTGFTYLFSEIRNEVFEESIHEIGGQKTKKDVVINFSGGFKGVIPYLTMFAQLYNLELIYCFDDSNNLITIKKSMLKFDWNLAEHLYPFLNEIRYSQLGQEEVNSVPLLAEHKLIRNENGNIKLSWFGAALLEYIEENMTTAKTPLSFMVEYKFLEYFMAENNYLKTGRSIHLNSGNQNSPELDLVLWKSESEIDICEVKSIGYFINKKLFNEFLTDQFSRQIDFIKNYTERKILSYRLLIYGTEIVTAATNPQSKYSVKNNLVKHLKAANNKFLKMKAKTDELNIDFLVSAYPIMIGQNDHYEVNNLYQNFYRTNLKKSNLIDYKIEITTNQ